MDDLIHQSSLIKAEALRLGFDGCGISRAEYLEADAARLESWLEKGYQGNMSYMANNREKRVDPSKLVEGARSVISVILNYYPSAGQTDREAPVLSKYAYGEDYHDVIRQKLNQLLSYTNSQVSPVSGRGFVDSAPVLDRAWAAKSGLGWIGKNTNLISPTAGSFFFIGTLIVDIPLAYDQPIHDFCGDCNRCIRACPTQAITEPRLLDATRCISYLTIEHREDIPPVFKNAFVNRSFGCDICQDVCPWNRKSSPHHTDELNPLPGILEMTRAQWYELDESRFSVLFSKSALKRTKFRGLRRNLEFIADSDV